MLDFPLLPLYLPALSDARAIAEINATAATPRLVMMVDQKMETNSRLCSSFRKALNTDKKERFLRRVKSAPLISTPFSLPPKTPLLSCPSTPVVQSNPSPDGPSVKPDSDLEELLRVEGGDATMAQITKDGLDRLFLELKSK